MNILASAAYAATQWNDVMYEDVPTIQSLEGVFGNVLSAIMALAAVALFVMLLIGGFNFLFSGGDPKKLETARGTISKAIMGIIVIAVSFLILLTIEKFTGVSVTKFEILKSSNRGVDYGR